MDLVTISDRFPKGGETVFGSEFFTGFGGKGANPCVMAARLGAQASLVGKVGDDEHGRVYKQHLEAEGVDIRWVLTEKNVTTGIATIQVESSTGENKIVIVPGANNLLTPQDVFDAEETIKGCSVLSTVLEIKPEVVLTALKLGQKHGVRTVLNAAPARADLAPEILENTDILVLNQTEAEIISGITGKWQVTTAKLKEIGCKNIIVTLGSEGAVLLQEKRDPLLIPAPKVDEVVDTIPLRLMR
ncbi:ribokinase isoform X3 [Eurytemora carolleeae]|uniref:ribokinase isoform X3 n=1 Tax=Eurytemora carolleeae TaxID=1294199 RepID=UPI000C76F06F|nr:ribokinase isoform X3 [Eurytemora carolleeae]|eukprot:XP_023326573.1 ribokinase-like isoform X3 [Eurytemora affinis]